MKNSKTENSDITEYRIFLVGMMGSGKSYWMKKLAKKLKVTGYDMDMLVEAWEGKTLLELFTEDGEAYARKADANVLRFFGEKKKYVVGTGGGSPCFHDNMKWMNSQGLTIWLNESEEVLYERLRNEKSHRPLISHLNDEELRLFISNKLSEREPFYSMAKLQVKGDDISERTLMKLVSDNSKPKI
jgi:shikimate kinase